MEKLFNDFLGVLGPNGSVFFFVALFVVVFWRPLRLRRVLYWYLRGALARDASEAYFRPWFRWF